MDTPGGSRFDGHAGRQHDPQAIQLGRVSGRDDQVNVTQAPAHVQQFLRGGDVGQNQASEGAAADVVTGTNQAHDLHRLDLRADAQVEGIPTAQAIAFGQAFR